MQVTVKYYPIIFLYSDVYVPGKPDIFLNLNGSLS